jgi:uncharacterized protein YecE (DUF72 family)
MAVNDPRAPRRGARIGCAGWSIPSVHAGLFGAGDSHLARYATRFDVVEINSTFHRRHAPAVFARWAASVPTGFRFSLKLSREITHDARLERTGDALGRFFDDAAGLGDKLGGVLVQLPPSLAFNAAIASRFFTMLRRRCTAPVACEPRHPSWFEPGVDAVWQAHAIARVAADPARLPAAAEPGGAGAAAGWHYWRWHGSPRVYYSAYADHTLRTLAAQLSASRTQATPAWCIFDNTAAGHAVQDAARLQALLGVPDVPR